MKHDSTECKCCDHTKTCDKCGYYGSPVDDVFMKSLVSSFAIAFGSFFSALASVKLEHHETVIGLFCCLIATDCFLTWKHERLDWWSR